VQITQSTQDGIAILRLAGNLDSATAPALQSAVSAVVAEKWLALDLNGVGFVASAGLRVMFAAAKRQKSKGGNMGMSNLRPGVRKVFEIVKALPDMNVFASEKEMDEYLARFQRPEE